jgi:hypothetical protein
LKQFEKDIIVSYQRIFLCEYNKMILVLFLILLVIYLLPVYQRPIIYHNFITPEERKYIIESAKKELSPSVVSEDRYIDDSVRKSETAWLSREDPIVENIMMRCLKHTISEL